MNAPVLFHHAAESESGMGRYMGPTEFFRILRRRRKLIALTIMLMTGLTALALNSVTPLYRSEAVIIVEAMDTPAGDPAASIASARENEIRVPTVLQLLQSRAIAELVVRDMALDDAREFNQIGRASGREKVWK